MRCSLANPSRVPRPQPPKSFSLAASQIDPPISVLIIRVHQYYLCEWICYLLYILTEFLCNAFECTNYKCNMVKVGVLIMIPELISLDFSISLKRGYLDQGIEAAFQFPIQESLISSGHRVGKETGKPIVPRHQRMP